MDADAGKLVLFALDTSVCLHPSFFVSVDAASSPCYHPSDPTAPPPGEYRSYFRMFLPLKLVRGMACTQNDVGFAKLRFQRIQSTMVPDKAQLTAWLASMYPDAGA